MGTYDLQLGLIKNPDLLGLLAPSAAKLHVRALAGATCH